MANSNPNDGTERGWREVLAQIFVRGPDPEIGKLSWPLRLLVVAGLAAVGAIVDGLPLAKQLTWGLQYAALIGVSLVASVWVFLLVANVVLGGSWLVLSWNPPDAQQQLPAGGERPPVTPLRVATAANRHWGHVEALATWTAVALAAWPLLYAQLPGVAALFLLGPPLVNGFTRFLAPINRQPTKEAGDLQLERRLWIYVATLAGLAFLTLCAPHQITKLLPLYFIQGGGLALRFWRFRRRKLQEEGNKGVRELRQEIVKQRSGRGATALDVVFGPGLIVVGVVAAIAVLSYREHARVGAIMQARFNGPAAALDRCVPEPGGPTTPSFEMFIVADTQLHELGGTRFPGQLELADTFVSVAIRPVELDLLAGAVLRNLGETFNAFAAEKKARPLWAHLGDFADLSCKGEMDRTLKLLDGFGPGLAGVAPGNHDRAFTGNFYWSPFWDTACRSSRLEKEDSDGKILAALGKHMVPGGRMEPIQRWSWRTGFAETPSALVSVSRLGVVEHQGAPHAVLGVFLDTSDRHASDFGIAGVNGTFSERQADVIRKLVAEAKVRDPDPLFIVFGHHPYGEVVWRSHERLQKLICELDGDARCGDGQAAPAKPSGPRVLAMISAHTHHAQRVRHCVGGRVVREIIVGSTLDPPQEAAWLEVGTDLHGRAALRVQSRPSVTRPAQTCGDRGPRPAVPTAARCRTVVAALAADASCRELFTRPGGTVMVGPPCAELQRPLSLKAKLEGLHTYGGPSAPAKIKALQERRAKNLLSCVCRKGDCKVLDDPFGNEAYEVELMARAGTPEGREELACLGWAASAVQAHKAVGMQMADALRCAFDDPTLRAAQESVAVLEDVPCE